MILLICIIMYTAPAWISILALIWFLKWVKKKGETEGWRKVGKEMMVTHMLRHN